MLCNLKQWMADGAAYAETKDFEPSVLLSARLAPDQYALLRQVQAACDSAKFAAARVAGKTPPVHDDGEQTWDELIARLDSVVQYLGTFTAADFEGAEERVVALPFMPGKGAKGEVYLNEMALPNFYFHVSMAYAILRHNGVSLGKRLYLGGFALVDL
jgi:hypothetical protein